MKREDHRSQYWAGGHTTSRLRYHIVFTPKYRKRILEGRLAQRLEELLREACEFHEWHLDELSIQLDHVHIMLQAWPKDSVSHILHILKGGTARAVRSEFPALQEVLWGSSFWADGFFSETVGHVDEVVVRNYIRSQ